MYVFVQSETTLAQSSFNVEKITEIQNRFTGGEVSVRGVVFDVWRARGPRRGETAKES